MSKVSTSLDDLSGKVSTTMDHAMNIISYHGAIAREGCVLFHVIENLLEQPNTNLQSIKMATELYQSQVMRLNAKHNYSTYNVKREESK